LEEAAERFIRRRHLKVRVDRDLCIGVGNCVAIAPTVFRLDDENKAVVLDPLSVDDRILLDAAESCPEQAIIVEDDEGHQLYP
jgi:ferredoxin